MKKECILSVLFIFLSLNGYAQQHKYSTFYYQRATLFESLPTSDEDIIFLGNSIVNGAEWHELFDNKYVKNRGISGDITMGVYDRLDPIVKGQPKKIFLLIGTNDMARGISADSIVHNIGLIVDKIKAGSPRTKIYLQSILPVSDCYDMFKGHTSRWRMVKEINEKLERMAAREKVRYIDLSSHFTDTSTGKMNPEYSNDGLHLLGNGYMLWRDIVLPYVKE